MGSVVSRTFRSSESSRRNFLRFEMQRGCNVEVMSFFFNFFFWGTFTLDTLVGSALSRVEEAVSLLDALRLTVISVKELTAVFFGKGIAIVEGFVLDVVFFLELGFFNTMVLDARILIMRSIFFPREVVGIGDGIFCGSVNICYGDGLW